MKLKKINDISFFQTDTITLAQNLIGKWIKTNICGTTKIAQISEVECYLGIKDSACHTYKGKRSNRTEPMWQQGGTIYIYLCYGIHNLLNIVSEKDGIPESVLIRAVTNANGPAKTTKYLNISKELNGQLIIDNNQIGIFDDDKKYSFKKMPRVGINYALPKDKDALLRFVLID